MTFLFEARSHFLESSSPLIASRLEILTDAISARRSTNAKDNTLGARELRKHHVSALRRGGCKPEDLSYGRLTLAFGAVFPEWIDGEARAPDATEQMRSFIQGGFISYVRAVYCVTLHLPDLSIRSHDYLQQSCRNNALNLLAKRKRDYEQGRAEAREQPIEEERCTVAEPPATVPLRLVIQILLRPLRQARRKYLGAIVHSSTATRELQTLTTRRKKYLQLRRVMRLWSQDYDEKEIMQKCNLSRPQVRYAISQLKAAITQAHVEGIETLSAQFSGGAVK